MTKQRAPKKGQYLQYLTWNDAEAILKGAKAVILPLGSNMKEHGLHLPLNNDWLIAEYLTARVLDELDLPSLPTMSYGFYPAFVDYPGSVTLSKETSTQLLIEVCLSIAKHGPKKIYVLNTGFSTNYALEPARQALAREGVILDYLDFLHLSEELEEGVKSQPWGSHADEIETSMMLFMHPEIVKLERAKPELNPYQKGPFSRQEGASTGIYSPTGSWGDPTLATTEKGKIVVERLVAKLITLITQFIQDDFSPAPPKDHYLR